MNKQNKYKKDGNLSARFDPIKRREYEKRYIENHHEELLQKKREYYQNNKEVLKQKSREYSLKNIDKKHQRDRDYNQRNHEKIMNYKENYRREHKEELRKKQIEYMDNPENIKRANKYLLDRIANDPLFAVAFRLRVRIRVAIRSYTKTGKIMTAKDYGIDYKAIIEHLKPFPEDLSKYHIDHILPLCSFNFINPDGSTNHEEIKKAFAPENHRWLLAEDNYKKISSDRKLSVNNR